MITVINKKTFKDPGDGIVIPIHRPHILGNPFPMYTESERDNACDKYKEWFDEQVNRCAYDSPIKVVLTKIKEAHKIDINIYLVCFCAPKRCHGDIIKEYIEKTA